MSKDRAVIVFMQDRPGLTGLGLLLFGFAAGFVPTVGVLGSLAMLAGLGFLGWAGFRLIKRKGAGVTSAPTGSTAPQNAGGSLPMTLYDEKGHTAPTFVRRDLKVFGQKFRIDWIGRDGTPYTNYIVPLRPTNAREVEMAYFILFYSAMWERAKRGYPIRDAKNDLIFPEANDDGFVVEKSENDDGSVDAVVCFDVYGPVDRDQYDAARKLDLAGSADRFKGLSAKGGERAYIPICDPMLKIVRLRPAQANDNPFRPRSTEKGAAQFAWVEEIENTSAVAPDGPENPSTGALLGWFQASDWAAGDGREGPIFAQGEGHRVIIGPPGSGKFTAAIAPLLLSADKASVFVFDVANGEAARITSPHRASLGPVLVLDPFGVSGLESGALNPLDFLKADDPDLLQAAKRLTDALFVTKAGNSTEDYFNDQARDVLTAYLLHVATAVDETDRTLRRVREIIRRPITPDLLAAMMANPAAGGMIADTAHNLVEAVKSDAEKNTFYVTQTLRANTAFLDLPAVIRATEKTTLDPAALRQQVSTLYVCLPEAELGQVGRWLRLVYSTVMEKVRTRTATPLHVVIDEFPSLGRFTRVKDDMALVRKFGIHIHIATQSLAQLDGVYERDWQAFMAAARYQQVFGVNDQMTADYISKRLGKTTRRSSTSGQSRQQGGGSQTTGESWHADDLMSPDELGRMHPEEQVIIVEGMNPLRLRKLRYHDNGVLNGRAGQAAGAAA